MAKHTYVEVHRMLVPTWTRFDVPPENQGQHVEVAYSEEHPCRTEAVEGAKYKRIIDRSLSDGDPNRVTYYKLVK